MVKEIILMFIVDIESIGNESASGCVKYLGKNVIELFIISSKTPCFFIYGRGRIMG